MKRFEVRFKEDEQGRRFPYIDVGAEDHGRPSFRLWVSGRLVQREDDKCYVVFPVHGARIERTERGSLVLRPAEGWSVYYLVVPCGFRGDSGFEILEPQGTELFPFKKYHSPRGSLGVDHGALVNVPDDTDGRPQPVKYRWERTGRLYGAAPEGISIVKPDGTVEDFDWVPDGLEALQELPTDSD